MPGFGGPLDPLQIIAKVEGEKEMEELAAKVGLLAQQVLKLNEQLKAGAISQKQFEASIKPLGRELAEAGRRAQEVQRQLQAINPSASNAGRGILQLGYVVDDLQYGFSAIVNNIPGVVQGLGGSAGLAGAAAALAVALSQVAKHWDEVIGKMSNPRSIDEAKSSLESIADFLDDLNKRTSSYLGGAGSGGSAIGNLLRMAQETYDARAEADARESARMGRVKAGESALEGAQSEDQKRRAGIIKKAIDAFPGGSDALLDDATNTILGGRRNVTKAQREKAQENAKERIGAAAAGDVGFNQIGQAIGKRFADAVWKEVDKETTAKSAKLLAKMTRDTEKEVSAQLAEERDAIREKIEAKQDIMADKQDRLARLNEQIADQRRHHYGFTQGTSNYLQNMQVSILNDVPKQQLEQQKLIKTEIEGLRKDVQVLHRQAARMR